MQNNYPYEDEQYQDEYPVDQYNSSVGVSPNRGRQTVGQP